MKSSLDFKIRSWLVRQISGQYKLETMTTKLDKIILHAVIEKIHEHLAERANAILNKTINELPQDMLSEVIAENKHLSDLQKSQIASILQTPSQRDNSSAYFG